MDQGAIKKRIMSGLRRSDIIIFLLLQISAAIAVRSFGQGGEVSLQDRSVKKYTIQIAASKVFIEPEFFRDKFSLIEKVSYFKKDGWYKYTVGSWKTEAEAIQKRQVLKLDGFVTTLFQSALVQEDTVKLNQKPLLKENLPVKDILPVISTEDKQVEAEKPNLTEIETRRLYNQMIRQADSVYNIAEDLLKAKRLYEEATLIDSNKNYPKDQIVEIEKQLGQKQPKSVLSRIPVRIILSAGGVSAVLIFGVVLFSRSRKKKRPESDANENPTDPDHPVLMEEISKLFPLLSEEIAGINHDPDLVREEIEKCLNSPSTALRLEAELALMHLDRDDPFSFLGKLRLEFTPWEQLHVIEMAMRNNLFLPVFSRWLNSGNESVVIFCRRMSGEQGIETAEGTSSDGMQFVSGELLESKIRQQLKLDSSDPLSISF